MSIIVRAYEEKDLGEMIRIWNEVVEDGVAFPQEELLEQESGRAFFASQTYCGVAVDESGGKVYGLYILHPNNVGREPWTAYRRNAGEGLPAGGKKKGIPRAAV